MVPMIIIKRCFQDYDSRHFRQAVMTSKKLKTQLILDDFRPEDKVQRRSFFDDRVEIISRRRLRKADVILLESLPDLNDMKVLCGFGSKGVVALAIQAGFPKADVHALELDTAAIGRLQNWKTDHELVGPAVHLVAELLDVGRDFDVILMPCPQILPRTLIAEFLAQSRQVLKKRGQLFVATDGEVDDWLRQSIKKEFGVQGTRLLHKRRYGYLWKAINKAPLGSTPTSHFRRHNFQVPGREALMLLTRPGLPGHDKISDETLALMELVSEGLTEVDSVLNLGCGAGLLGLFLAASNPNNSVMMLDCSARAVDMTEQNRAANGIDNANVLLDSPEVLPMFQEDSNLVVLQGLDRSQSHGESLIVKAHRALSVDGRLFFATRNGKRWGAFLKSHWQSIETKRLRKLTVFMARKKLPDQ
jgi:16S rRNA G1207 methylase RsmC